MKYDFLVTIDPNTKIKFTTEQLNLIEECLDIIPIQVVSKLYCEEWKIVAFSELSHLPPGHTVSTVGSTVPNERLIYLKTLSDKVSFKTTLIHEIAHVWDIRFSTGIGEAPLVGTKFISDSKHRNKIDELKSGECADYSQYHKDSYIEFYANTFRLYIQSENKVIQGKPNATAWIKSTIEEGKSMFIESFNSILSNAVTCCEFSQYDNRLIFKNRYGKSLTSVTLPDAENGGSVADADIVFSNDFTFEHKATDFPNNKITISYISSSYNNGSSTLYGAYILKTDRKIVTRGQGVECYQERVLYFGEPNEKPINRECRYYETNVTRQWSEWYPINGELDSPGYTLPIASPSVLGGVKVGNGLSINGDGKINVTDDTLVNKSVSGGILTLSTDKFQFATLSNGNVIKLPTTSNFKEIHLFFKTTTDLTLVLPSVKWQTVPSVKANKSYEFIFTYVNSSIGWLGGVVAYE